MFLNPFFVVVPRVGIAPPLHGFRTAYATAPPAIERVDRWTPHIVSASVTAIGQDPV
jgi:hypothetical protein